MDDSVKTMLTTYISAFDSFPCNNEKVKAEIDAFKTELTAFAQSAKDLTAFMADYDAKGYGKRYIDLFGKIAQSKASELTVEEIEERQRQITPKTFVEQYRTAYDAVKACKYRKKAEQAYQRLFDLAERSGDMLDFNIESEKQNLMFKLSADDSIEQTEIIMQASDPLDKIVYPQYPKRIENWQKAQSDADITYYTEIEQIDISQNSMREQDKMTVISAVAMLAIEYVVAKHLVLTATKDDQVQSGLGGMIKKRSDMKRMFSDILPHFGLNWETICNDRFYRRLLLNPTNLDALGRIKKCYHPQNIEAIHEIITEEMLPEKPVAELVFRPANTPIIFDTSSRKTDEIAVKYEKIAAEMNKDLDYYKYVQAATSAPEFQQGESSGMMKFTNRFFKK